MINKSSIILNFLPVQAGGGLQNSLSFLNVLINTEADLKRFTVVTRRDSVIHQLAVQLGLESIAIYNSTASRLAFELTCRHHFHPGQLCFTIFGPPLIGTAGYLLNICGIAYSNLYYPEVVFWKQYAGLQRLKLEIIDRIRLMTLCLADYWVFETHVLAQRAKLLGLYPEDRVGVVRMAPSSLVSFECIRAERAAAYDEKLPKGFRFLFLSSAATNKRIDRMAPIAAELKCYTDSPFVIVTTMSVDEPYYNTVKTAFAQHGVSDHFYNIGPCPSEHVASLISVCDSMCLFSILESFSNNFVESWQMRKPLVVADYDWSRAIAGLGAMYIDPEQPAAAAKRMADLMNDSHVRQRIIEQGVCQLKEYPTAETKCQIYLEQIETARLLGRMPAELRRQIMRRCLRRLL